MNNLCFYLGGTAPTTPYTKAYLQRRGLAIAEQPDSSVTHVLLPVPTKDFPLEQLTNLNPNAVILGGNLDALPDGIRKVDFLQEPLYLAKNAAITADCTIGMLMDRLPVTLEGVQVLILGFGRIGKCLARRLQSLGAVVTVWARKQTDLAMAVSLGCREGARCDLNAGLIRYRVILNTIPAPILSRAQTEHCRPDCLMLDLASKPGIEDDRAIWARGLPAKLAPESSGHLIAATAIRMALRQEV